MKSYCVKQKKFTNSLSGSEKTIRSKNGKLMIKSICAECGAKKSRFIKKPAGSSDPVRGPPFREDQRSLAPNQRFGGSFDIHKLIGKLPRPKSGFTPGNYKYMGPYNPLDKQLKYDSNTGKVQEWYVKPFNKVDEIAAHHDICYQMGKSKNECDQKMVNDLDNIPYGEMPKWGQTARFLINAKKKLGLGVKQKNVKC